MHKVFSLTAQFWSPQPFRGPKTISAAPFGSQLFFAAPSDEFFFFYMMSCRECYDDGGTGTQSNKKQSHMLIKLFQKLKFSKTTHQPYTISICSIIGISCWSARSYLFLWHRFKCCFKYMFYNLLLLAIPFNLVVVRIQLKMQGRGKHSEDRQCDRNQWTGKILQERYFMESVSSP